MFLDYVTSVITLPNRDIPDGVTSVITLPNRDVPDGVTSVIALKITTFPMV